MKPRQHKLKQNPVFVSWVYTVYTFLPVVHIQLIGPWDMLDKFFPANLGEWWLRYLLINCHQVIVTGPDTWLVNIGPGNGLVSSGIKPLPEPMSPYSFTMPQWVKNDI